MASAISSDAQWEAVGFLLIGPPKTMQLPQDQRALLYLGAAFATTQLQKLAPPFTGRLGKGANLAPREVSVLRSLSLGYRVAEISRDLGLGEETVRSHIKKAQTKLNVRNPMHAVAQAMNAANPLSLPEIGDREVSRGLPVWS